MTDRPPFDPSRIRRLNDPSRLQKQVNEDELARVLALRGDEDVIDLGSGTGFYTDRIAALTTGTVYAVEFVPEMNEHYRERGLPTNVRLIPGDITALPIGSGTTEPVLTPSSADLACTIATWHEIGGNLDLPGLTRVLRPGGRLIVIDWRRDPESWEGGPPEAERYTKAEVAEALAPAFTSVVAEDLGRSMFVVTAQCGGAV